MTVQGIGRRLDSMAPCIRRTVRYFSAHFVGIVAVTAMLVYGVTYAANCFGDPVRADGAGYFAYLPSYLIYGDSSYEAVVAHQYGGVPPGWAGILPCAATGRLAIMYNIGVAVMMAPFFIVAHVLTMSTGLPRNGYSFFYQHAAGLSGLFYMVAGVGILRRALLRQFSDSTVLLTLACLVYGTNLLHYGSGESVLSHPYSFFLVSSLIWLVPEWYSRPHSLRLTVLLGVVVGCIPLVRTPNALFLLFVPLYGLMRLRDLRPRAQFYMRHTWPIATMAMIAFLVFLPQMLIWRLTLGRWIANSYHMLYPDLVLADFRHPHVMETLFSLRAGVLFWSPVLTFALAGFFLLRRRVPELFLPAALVIIVNFFLIASWHDWAFGGAFPHRGFVESYAVLAFPLAACFERALASRIGVVRWGVPFLCFALVGFVLFLMTLYYTRELSYYGLDRQALFDIFWWRYHAVRNWFRL